MLFLPPNPEKQKQRRRLEDSKIRATVDPRVQTYTDSLCLGRQRARFCTAVVAILPVLSYLTRTLSPLDLRSRADCNEQGASRGITTLVSVSVCTKKQILLLSVLCPLSLAAACEWERKIGLFAGALEGTRIRLRHDQIKG